MVISCVELNKVFPQNISQNFFSYLIWFLFKLGHEWLSFYENIYQKYGNKNEENSSSTWLAPLFQLIFHVVTQNTNLDKSLDKNCLLYEKHCHFVRRFSLLIYVCTYQWYHTSIYLYYLVVLLDDVVDIDFVVVFTKNDTNFFVFFLLIFVLWFKSANWLGLQLGGSLNQIWNWIHRFHRNFFYIEGVPLENPFLIGHLLIVLYYNTTYRPTCII